jgi:hypothetical protein
VDRPGMWILPSFPVVGPLPGDMKKFWILCASACLPSCTRTSTCAAVSFASPSPAPGSGQRKTICRLGLVKSGIRILPMSKRALALADSRGSKALAAVDQM